MICATCFPLLQILEVTNSLSQVTTRYLDIAGALDASTGVSGFIVGSVRVLPSSFYSSAAGVYCT